MLSQARYYEGFSGLSAAQAADLKKQYGANAIRIKRFPGVQKIFKSIAGEPMLILLAVAATLYFILRQHTEGIAMILAIVLISSIALYQRQRSGKAIRALSKYTTPRVTAIRDGIEHFVESVNLVPGDMIILSEGETIPADALVLKANDLMVNEAVITGESIPVRKETGKENQLLRGTTITSGRCVARVTATGLNTSFGKMGKSIGTTATAKTQLQAAVMKTVNKLAGFGVLILLLILLSNYIRTQDLVSSILLGLTIAMAAIPEEIPVAFSSFIALGGYDMSRIGIIARNPQAIENIGNITVLCLDKTGTITENSMAVAAIYEYPGKLLSTTDLEHTFYSRALYFAALASERDPFDMLEKAILDCYILNQRATDSRLPDIVHEYPLEGRQPMMTHLYRQQGGLIVAGKGAPERIINLCDLDEPARKEVTNKLTELTSKGYKVIGVASADYTGMDYPRSQDDFNWRFEGLVALYDPPRKEAQGFISEIKQLHIKVLLTTGDHPATSGAIAAEIGMVSQSQWVTGDQLMQMTEEAIIAAANDNSLFVRMYPEAKVKLIQMLQSSGETVAMIGDGVNDAAALKLAHVGIAMGKQGTDITRLAADLVLTEDNLYKVTEAINYGKRIVGNLKKAIGYIIAIHIPILVFASLPVLLNWTYPALMSPVHIIFLELIMGPTCSIFFQREPANAVVKRSQPGPALFSGNELLFVIIEGILVSAGILLLYQITASRYSPQVTRTTVFLAFLVSNLLLTFINRSFRESFFHTIRYKNQLVPYVLLISTAFILAVYLAPAVRRVFGLELLPMNQLATILITCSLICLLIEISKSFLNRFEKR